MKKNTTANVETTIAKTWNEMTIAELVADYNAMATELGQPILKTFRSKEYGIARLEKITAEYDERMAAKLAEEQAAAAAETEAPKRHHRAVKKSNDKATYIELIEGGKVKVRKLYYCGDIPVVAVRKRWCIVEADVNGKAKPGKVLPPYEGRPQVVAA